MPSKNNPSPWYASTPARFECTGCSKCCKRDGVVEFTTEDITRISAYRDVTPDVFKALYLEEDHEGFVVVVSSTHPCVFLDQQGQCSVHEVKPVQCASYPFWPELLESQEAWSEEATLCEGIGRGEPLSHDDVSARTLDSPQPTQMHVFTVHEEETTH